MFVRVDQLRCVVIGGGHVAARKVRGLLDAGAQVTLVAPELHADLQLVVAEHRIEWIAREARADDLEGANVVFLATPSREVNDALEQAARQIGALINRADAPDEGTFHVPSIVRRGDIAVAISTGGRGPGFARQLREELETILTDTHVGLLDAIAEARQVAQASGISIGAECWRELLRDDTLVSYVRSGGHTEAVSYILENLATHAVSGNAR